MTITLRELREARGFSQQDLAVRALIHERTVRLIEHGHTPTRIVRKSLADALGVSPAELWPDKA